MLQLQVCEACVSLHQSHSPALFARSGGTVPVQVFSHQVTRFYVPVVVVVELPLFHNLSASSPINNLSPLS